MRRDYPWLAWMLGAAACGTTAPVGETDAADTSSTTVMITSNDGENTTVPLTESSSSSTADTGTTSSTDTGSTTGESTTGTTEGTTTDASGTESSSDDDSGSSTAEPPGPACADGCVVEFECGVDEWKSAEACTTWCEANLIKAAEFSLFCHDAWENLSECFGTLTCEEYAEYLEPTMFPYPCSIEADSLMFECKGQ